MKCTGKHTRFFGLLITAGLAFTACSNLFENVYNDELKPKTGDDSLKSEINNPSGIFDGLVVIKKSEPDKNQITYSPSQKLYFVGSVPSAYNDYTVSYKNGSEASLLGKDSPVEFRCFANDKNVTVQWTAKQTWEYIPVEVKKSFKDKDGNDVVYRGISSQYAEKLTEEKDVPFIITNSSPTENIIQADLPYGVTEVNCRITADDSQYFTDYKIILTKEYVKTTALADENNVTDFGLVVIKATDPGRNAINFSSTTFEYEIGDSTGRDTSLDLTGRDDPLVFKCFPLDKNSELTWKAFQVKKYVPVTDEKNGGVVSQSLEALEKPLAFDFVKAGESYTGSNPFMQFVSSDSVNEVMSDLPYGVTEVYARITGYNENENGELVSNISEYKITLTKRYVITTGQASSEAADASSGLSVMVSGKEGNLISYHPSTLDYTISGLTGANETCTVKFYPEEIKFTELSWKAVQTQTYESKIITEAGQNGVNYTLHYGDFKDITPLDLLANKSLSISDLQNGSLCAGNLPYGTTVVYVTSKSLADSNSFTTYSVTFHKKRVATNIDIVSVDGTSKSTITDKGLVVLSAEDNYALNQINYSSSVHDYNLTVTALDNGENGMKFRCYLEDSEASLAWSLVQTAEFEAILSSEEVTDDITGTTSTVSYISGQRTVACSNAISYTSNGANEISAMIPYGITKLQVVISAPNESSSTYTITLTRNIYDSSVSETGSNSLLKDMDIVISSGDEESKASLSPKFSPTTTVYKLTVDEEADSLSIDAIAESIGAEISSPTSITKYGSVPGIEGMSVPLVGGTSRISFTVTDETNVSRTYYIYVEKPEDGDTSLCALDYTPANGYKNGLDGFTFDETFTGLPAGSATEGGAAKYSVKLSADDRKDVNKMIFTAIPTNKRTKVYYGLSSSVSQLPADEEWSEAYGTKALPLTYNLDIADQALEEITKILWIKTETDAYYHHSGTTYESEKRSDITYHKVQITKSGDSNQNLTALVVVATYENGKTATILSQMTSEEIGYKTVSKNVNVTTFADKLDFYFRPLDKDAEVAYTAKNTAHKNDSENTEFTGYAPSAQSLSKITGTSDVLNDGSDAYYHFSLGEIQRGTASTKDLPNGTTSVKICGITYNFIKPDLSTVSYGVSASDGDGNGVYKPMTYYIYLKNSVTSLKMNLTTNQQNESIEVNSCIQTADVNGNGLSLAEGEESIQPGWSLHHYNVSAGENIVKWQLLVGNASESVENYNQVGKSDVLSTEIPVGTTQLSFTVRNGGSSGNSSQEYIYYIIRASDNESRLNALTIKKDDEKDAKAITPAGFVNHWAEGMTENDYYYNAYNQTLGVDAGNITIYAHAVSEKASIVIKKAHSNSLNIENTQESVNAALWYDEEELADNVGSLSYTHTISANDAGSLRFIIEVTSGDGLSKRYYNMIVKVEADKTVRLDSLRIVQKGTNNSAVSDSEDRILLGASFNPATYDYAELNASLNYVGDIIITPEVYPKASITEASITRDGLAAVETNAVSLDENNVITLHYESYKEHLGANYTVSYTVQAQDSSVEPVTYTANIQIPEYRLVTETKTYTTSTNYSYQVPEGYSSVLGYRFGSVIADETSPLQDHFGGIDIIGSSTLDRVNPVWYESSYAASGIQFLVKMDETIYGVALDSQGQAEKFYTFDFDKRTVTECSEDNKPNIKLTVEPSFVYENSEPYLALKFTLKNPSGRNVMLGAAIDTLVGTVEQATNSENDSVEVLPTNNGFTMKGSEYSFAVCLKNAYGVDDVDNIWYGPYEGGKFINNVFDSSATSGLSSGEDSAAAFSWNLGNAASYEKTIRFTMKSVN